MKLITLITILIFQQLQVNATVIESTTKGSIGRKSNDCKGLGLCLSQSALLNLGFAFDDNKNVLTITIQESEIKQFQPTALGALKDKNTFTFEEDLLLPVSLVSSLRYPSEIIVKGIYKLIYTSGRYTIIIQSNK